MVSGMMHEKYENAFIKQKTMAELTVHTEGSSDNFPKIIPYKDSEKEYAWNKWFDKELIAYFLLGFGLGYIEKNKNRYVLNFEPDNPTSTKYFDISNSNILQHGILFRINFDNKRFFKKIFLQIILISIILIKKYSQHQAARN